MPVDVSRLGAAQGDSALAQRLQEVALALLDGVGAGERELSVVLTDDAHMQSLNLQWRGEDKTTDVLSFPLDEGEPVTGAADERPLGDIVISVQATRAAADALGQPLLDHAVFLLIHGLCHLLGHDHGAPEEAAAMRAQEDRLLALVAPGQQRPPTPY